MVTEHVALAIMHGTSPEAEAHGTETTTPTGRKKRTFESATSVEDRRKSKMESLTKILPKTIGLFLVSGIAEVKTHKKSNHVYLKLVDKEGKEPIKGILESKENVELYDGTLTKIEDANGLSKGSPKVVLCLRSTYWSKSLPKAPKAPKAPAALDPGVWSGLNKAASNPTAKPTVKPDSKKQSHGLLGRRKETESDMLPT